MLSTHVPKQKLYIRRMFCKIPSTILRFFIKKIFGGKKFMEVGHENSIAQKRNEQVCRIKGILKKNAPHFIHIDDEEL